MKISSELVPKGPFNNISALVHMMGHLIVKYIVQQLAQHPDSINQARDLTIKYLTLIFMGTILIIIDIFDSRLALSSRFSLGTLMGGIYVLNCLIVAKLVVIKTSQERYQHTLYSTV